MTHLRSVFVALLGAASLVVGGTAVQAADSDQILGFESMTPITGAAVSFPGPVFNDRGIVGGGKPWAITEGQGQVDSDGTVQVEVTGLVIPVAPFNGTNPVKMFGATVSCITAQGAIVNLHTAAFPATPTGDASFEGALNGTLPHPCLQPILFVTSAGGAWFAESNASPQQGDAQN